ncbi:MAG: hypothetical protein WBB29_02980 [Geitlerinemataceae cyanobacterium]
MSLSLLFVIFKWNSEAIAEEIDRVILGWQFPPRSIGNPTKLLGRRTD